MTDVRLSLLVLRSGEPERLRAFYESIVGSMNEEQHGKGPVHWSVELGPTVLEIYPLGTDLGTESTAPGYVPSPGPQRLGFSVPDVDELLTRMNLPPEQIIAPVKTSPWGRRAVVRDPEGRAVELLTPTKE